MARVSTQAVFTACVGVLLCAPPLAHAAVVFSEIAWMGTLGDGGSYCEWIELHNTGGSAVDLSGWTLRIGTTEKALSEGSGTSLVVPAGDFFVLERDTTGCADPVSGMSDWSMSFGTGLPNAGTTLALRRSGGEIEDQVAGGTDWGEIGGDNETKETAQYTSGGWITAAATPGAANASTGTDAEPEEEDTEEADSGSTASVTSASSNAPTGSTAQRISLAPDDDLRLSVYFRSPVFVGSAVDFLAVPSGLEDSHLRTLRYEWNFGDGSTDTDRSPVHTYAHPGNYVVVLRAYRAGHEATVRADVTVLPYKVSLARADDGSFIVHNDAAYEIDLSGLALTDGYATFTMPEHTYIRARGSLVLPPTRTGLLQPRAFLYDRTLVELARYPSPAPVVGQAPQASPTVPSTPTAAAEEQVAVVPATTTLPAVSAQETEARSSHVTTFAFAGVLVVGILALYAHKLAAVPLGEV